MNLCPEELPDSWESVSISVISEINPKLDKKLFEDELEVSFVPMPAVGAEDGKINTQELRTFGQVKKGYTAFSEGDVLFAKITPCMENGKMAVVPSLRNGLGFGSTEFHVLRSYKGILPEWIYYYVSSKLFRIEAEHNMTGAVGQRRVPAPWLAGTNIPLPPLNEQHRIVAKIEELFSELDKGIESLTTAKAQLQVYRQSLLKHAFEGKLTEQWRKDHQDELESTDELLARIQDEREARYQQQVADWQESVKQWEESGKEGRKPKQPTAFSSFRSLDNEDVSGFSDLPKNWVYTRFENLIEYVTSGSRGWAKYYDESGAKFIRAQNLKYDRLDLSDIAYVALPDSVEGRRTLINDKDLLITITGANVTKTAYVNGDIGEAYVSQHVALTRLINTDMAQYVHWYLIASTEGRRQLERSAYGAGKPGLNLDNIKDVIIPISSVSECKAITQQLSEKLSVIDEQILEIDIALKKSEALRQSILKKAFSGQLVSQDPNDEPASELLKHIAVEKAELEAQAKQAKAASRKPRKKTTAA
ncbi:MAG: hypothetical protein CMH98_13480 [Oceanospirillaceae bacterium]|nr:hypothetical protein [Oceanospirillaceae bacterium]